jgi:hypothetical protein
MILHSDLIPFLLNYIDASTFLSLRITSKQLCRLITPEPLVPLSNFFEPLIPSIPRLPVLITDENQDIRYTIYASNKVTRTNSSHVKLDPLQMYSSLKLTLIHCFQTIYLSLHSSISVYYVGLEDNDLQTFDLPKMIPPYYLCLLRTKDD